LFSAKREREEVILNPEKRGERGGGINSKTKEHNLSSGDIIKIDL
jgi:hypothetical protein